MNLCSLVQAGIMFILDDPEIEEPDSLEVLKFEHIIFPLVILGLGTSLAILVFLCEIWFRKSQKPIQLTDGYEVDQQVKPEDVDKQFVKNAENTD